MSTVTVTRLDGAALDAWRGYLTSHASILRALDAELVAEHGLTTRDYEVLLFLAQAEDAIWRCRRGRAHDADSLGITRWSMASSAVA